MDTNALNAMKDIMSMEMDNAKCANHHALLAVAKKAQLAQSASTDTTLAMANALIAHHLVLHAANQAQIVSHAKLELILKAQIV